MESELLCPFCKRFYVNPILLSCCHSLCLACAKRLQVPITFASGLNPVPGDDVASGDVHDCSPDQVDAASIISETDSGVVCRSRPNSYLGTPCVPLSNPIDRAGNGGSQSTISCAVCKKITFVADQPGHDVWSLPRNKALEAVVERYRETKQYSIDCQTCPEGSRIPANVRCQQCQIFQCNECQINSHPPQNVVFGKHTFVSIDEGHRVFNAPQEMKKCLEHSNEVVTMFCCECKVFLCSVCAQSDGRHECHEIQLTSALCKMQKFQLSQLLHNLSEKIRSGTEFIHHLKRMQESIEGNYKQFEACISAQCDAIIEDVKRQKKILLTNVRDEQLRKEEIFKEKIISCTSNVHKTTGLLQFSIEILKETDQVAFLQISNALVDRVSNVYQSFNNNPSDSGLTADVELSLDCVPVTDAVQSLSLTPLKEPNPPLIIADECRSENNTVTVVWCPANHGSIAAGYILELDDGNKGSFQEVYCGSEAVCLVEGLQFGKQYMARVKAFNKAGHSQYSNYVCIQTSHVAWFSFDTDASHRDVLFSNDNLTVTSSSFDDRVVLANIGLSSGIHYWELMIDRFDNNKDPAFGVAYRDVAKDKMIGKDNKGWSMYIDGSRSWFMHSGHHFERTEGGISSGSVVGVLLDLNRHNISFYVNGDPHGPVISTEANGTFYPAVSLNRNVQITLTSGLEIPIDADLDDE